MKIANTTDGNYIGQEIEDINKIVLGGVLFIPDKVQRIDETTTRYSNSNYIIEVKE
jgi:hypothetical protein